MGEDQVAKFPILPVNQQNQDGIISIHGGTSAKGTAFRFTFARIKNTMLAKKCEDRVMDSSSDQLSD